MTDHRAHPTDPADETPEQRRARHQAQHEHDLMILAASGETDWWDEDGRPAPWPTDFFDHDTRWRPQTGNTPHSTSP